ncbi:helix-turn-helix domain-containing protein [Nocardia sp. 2YAB30]|uniref:winged helix-turn-helix domain-containing protein n=1 Tax=Nocardia sp. 2YAB30 TaxID=3233022 RepID=UPI003F966F86
MAGQPTRLTPTEFELLSILAERVGSVVSRAQLMDRVWGDAFVAVRGHWTCTWPDCVPS